MLIEAFVRRVNLTGLSAAAKSLRTRMFRRRIYFAHIPKSGGTSLSHMMRARYPVSYFKLDEDASREACPGAAGEWMRFKSRMASYHAALGRNFVQAHAPVTRMMLDRFADEYQFVTILRDPVDRALSSYFFDPRLRAMTPEAFVKSERFSIEANVLGHFFGELDWDGGGDANRAVARAIENLERFDVVGLLEYDEDLSRQFREKIGFQVRLPKRNVGSNRTDNDIEAWLRGPLTEACAHDYRIYNHFAARVAAPSVDGGANAGLVGSGAGADMAGQGDIALAGHSTSETPSATRLPCAVIIATKGRPDYARRIVDALAAQTLRPERVVVVGSEAADLFADDGPVGPGALQPELVLAGRPGLTIQRNAGLDLLVRTGAFADGLAFIAFFDDDFLPAPDWLEACAEVFADRPDVVGVTGHVLADGIKLAGYTFEEAESFLDGRRPPTPHWTDRPDRSETEGAYGCNMAFRADLTETLRFDEELPLYGWQEDSDYTAQVRRYGPVLFARTCRGVHMGTKSGRTSGVRMGYSQVANPIHIVGRGNMKVSRAAFLVGRALVANALKSLSPPEFIDYRGRLRGSAIALADLVRGRCRPGRILEL